jgi:hypothetical protein
MVAGQGRPEKDHGGVSPVLAGLLLHPDRRLPVLDLRGRPSSGGLGCAAMNTGTALRHTRIGDPVLF